VEAYIGESDRASHARFGPTPRNRIMYGPPGCAYVYLVYGMHDCLNVVTEPVGAPAALLIRAIEPLEGLPAMRLDRMLRSGRGRRGWTPERAARVAERLARVPDAALAAGPGLVTAAFGIDTSWTGMDLCDPSSPLRLESRPPDETPIVQASRRIGVDYAGPPWTERPWRFTIAGG
jgi:DNA-3-methyladenine glycosylase